MRKEVGVEKKRLVAIVVVAAVGLFSARQVFSQTPSFNLVQFSLSILSAIAEPVDDPLDPPGFFTVKPQEFDPAHTDLVQAAWINSIGCPTAAIIAIPNATFTGVAGTTSYADTACPSGDPQDKRHQGLLLAKTGPTSNFAAAVAELHKVKGITLTELGWDIRKMGASGSPLGSHCGAGAPRWDISTMDGVTHFIGCNSPPPAQTASATGWIRMRWTPAAAFPPILPTDVVSRIQIVFDEGQDAGPDFFGAAVLDNIDVNGAIVGHGATDAS
jgi:hypothetical protein